MYVRAEKLHYMDISVSGDMKEKIDPYQKNTQFLNLV